MTGLLGLESLATHAAGLRMKTDVEQGYWFSISNRPLLGVTGVEIGLTARADDPQSETNRLNEKGITTVFNSYGTGYRMWGIRLRDLIKGVPSKVDVKGYDPKSKQTVSASRSSKSRRGKAKHGSTGDTLRIVPNKGESAAQLNARADAKLADAQDDQCAGTVTLVGNALLVAGQMVRLKGFGKFSGKYLVKQSRHAFTRRGWTTELEIKMTEYVADEEQADANANPNP